MDNFQWFDSVIIELEGAFLSSPNMSSDLKSHAYDVTSSAAWFDFQKGLMNQEQCQHCISLKLGLPQELVRRVMEAARPQAVAPGMRELVKQLRQRHTLFAVGNLPSLELHRLEQKLDLSNSFNDIFTSSTIGERLPFPGFFKNIVTPKGNIEPRRTLYISSDLDNAVTARSLGFYVMQGEDVIKTATLVRSITSDPLPRALAFLHQNSGNLDLTVDLGFTLKDAFAQFIILDATNNPSLLHPSLLPPHSPPLYSWLYAPAPNGILPYSPPDIDTNSFAFSALPSLPPASAHAFMDKMLYFRSRDGILHTYLTPDRTRLDATACVNALTLFHQFGRGHEVPETEAWIYSVLKMRAYARGTRYYHTGDFFLYFVSRLILLGPPHVQTRFGPTFRDCVAEVVGNPGDALALALRVVCMARAGLNGAGELQRLLALQSEDGSWGDGCCYQFSRIKAKGYHRGLTAALAVLAVREWNQARREGRF